MRDAFLDRPTLESLCDTVQPKRMATWLQAHGWPFEPGRGRSGLPKVARAYFEARMSGQAPTKARTGPRLDFFAQP